MAVSSNWGSFRKGLGLGVDIRPNLELILRYKSYVAAFVFFNGVLFYGCLLNKSFAYHLGSVVFKP